MGLNPSGSVGLGECTDAQFKKGEADLRQRMPGNSAIGTVEIESPPLAQPLTGSIYVGTQKSSNPESGEEFRILVEAKEPKEGIDVRLVGNTAANTTTGQLTTTFNEKEVGELAGALPEGLPQVPFTSVKLKFDGSHVGADQPVDLLAPKRPARWNRGLAPGEQVASSRLVHTLERPGRRQLPDQLRRASSRRATRAASRHRPRRRKYSPFDVHIARTDGQQELKVVNVTLPKGLVGQLAGIPYCSDAALAAAAAAAARPSRRSRAAPRNSAIGAATTVAGTGDTR